MARTNDPNSATSQFFINLVNNEFLDYRSKTPQGWGYAVFGKVTAGMDVVNRISKARTAMIGGMQDVPIEPVVITKATYKP
jgi:peptidylprolyl isomerase/peptidyl-prolyl cis-trans isomerase A (cyclophilin A)/peptidyl-prolyl cis-trans isomerase B (cyclophilin B)